MSNLLSHELMDQVNRGIVIILWCREIDGRGRGAGVLFYQFFANLQSFSH